MNLLEKNTIELCQRETVIEEGVNKYVNFPKFTHFTFKIVPIMTDTLSFITLNLVVH